MRAGGTWRIPQYLLIRLVAGSVWSGNVIAGGAEGPGQGALEFLSRARDGGIDLGVDGDTALRGDMTPEKKEEIREMMGRLGRELKGGRLVMGEIREEDGYAGAIVKKEMEIGSAGLQVFPVAMVFREGGWHAAPVPASFENSVEGYTLGLREKLGGLEEWMIRQRVLELGRLQEDSRERFQSNIRATGVGGILKSGDIGVVAGEFLAACERKDKAAILGFLGGLENPLPTDWEERELAAGAAVEGRGAWELLVSDQVLRTRVLVENRGDSGIVTVGCLKPSRARESEPARGFILIHLAMRRDGKAGWRIDLPDMLAGGGEEAVEMAAGLDKELLDEFPVGLRRRIPAAPESTAEECEAKVLSILKGGGMEELIGRTGFGTSGRDGRIACSMAAEMWWTLNGGGKGVMPLRLGGGEEGGLAVALYQWLSLEDDAGFQPRRFFFKKSEGGWLWVPESTAAGDKKNFILLDIRMRELEKEAKNTWLEKLEGMIGTLGKEAPEKAASDQEAGNLAEAWVRALNAGDAMAAMKMTVVTGAGREGIFEGLRNLGDDIEEARGGGGEVLGIFRSQEWVAIGVRYGNSRGARNVFLPIIVTRDGPRVLVEARLVSSDGDRTRKFLNEASFSRLGDTFNKKLMLSLRRLMEEFEEKVKIP